MGVGVAAMREFLWVVIALVAIVGVGAGSAAPPWIAVAHADDDDDDDDDDDRPVRRKALVRVELVAVGLSDAAISRLMRRGFQVMTRTQSQLFDRSVVRLLSPRGRSRAASLRDIRAEEPAALVASNDLYRRNQFSSYRTESSGCGEACVAFALTQWRPETASCSRRVVIGMIDTGVDLAHPVLQGARITSKVVRRSDRRASDPAHGTGVASVLAGRPQSVVRGVVPEARILAADAFHRAGAGDAADAFDLVMALDWVTANGAGVINMSLSGPANEVLEKAVAGALARNVSIVAAAGKVAAGPATGYPARYPGVIAVSGIDGRLRALRSSNRGDHIAFAAPGAGIVVAGKSGSISRVDGTSFAAPFVAAAIGLHTAAGRDVAAASDRLRAAAKDLGAPGRDPVFGWGLIQFHDLPQC